MNDAELKEVAVQAAEYVKLKWNAHHSRNRDDAERAWREMPQWAANVHIMARYILRQAELESPATGGKDGE